MTATNLSAMSIAELSREIADPTPAHWANASESELRALKKRCDEHWTSTSAFLHSGPLAIAVGAGLALAVLVLKPGAFSTEPHIAYLDYTLLFAVLTFGFAMAACVTAVLVSIMAGLDRAEAAAKALGLLKDSPSLCEAALKCVDTSARAKAYRDSVLEVARELRVIDCHILSRLTDEDQRGTSQRRNEAVCRQLHGMPELEA